MASGLLKDQKFIKIQKLNSIDNGRKKKSIIINDGDFDAVSDGSFVDLNDEKIEKIKIIEDNIESISSGVNVKIPANSLSAAASNNSTVFNANSEYIERHIKIIDGRARSRYKRNTKEAISYFGDVSFQTRPSILDGSINNPYQEKFSGPIFEKISFSDKNSDVLVASNFGGFYVLAWMSVAFSCFKMLIEYYNTHDHSFKDSEILHFMTTDLFTVAAVDLMMYSNLWFIFAIQWLCKMNILKWKPVGRMITAIFESCFVIFYIILTENILGLHWVAKIFLFLHSLVLLMKMHSFAFYNGYLWNIKSELSFSTRALKKYYNSENKEVIETLNRSKDFCTSELNAISDTVAFPENINVKNFFMYTMFPTLVYQVEYPRTERIRWRYVLEKACAIFGTIFLMMLLAQTYMYPVAMRAIAVKHTQWQGYVHRAKQWAELLIDLVPSFITMYILNFYLIWDAILNCIAELTCFGDRYFYGDWWNCVDWGDFSRIWNIPVHKFLLRHVYHSSISFLNLSKSQATLMTFFISSVVHELAMYVIFKKLRCYLFILQMTQLPLVTISKTKYFRDRTIINNVFFWLGICTGPSIMCTLYLTF
ncbi:hypothetical protein TPHA_0H02220 [Tetrapisispora phaffii CBS 4417]|uniref:O-acyltransferase n=1 Tax=Tetrapisispora phaffii (strain ATCC 24235 / CBS 4417 / NBRC 1672 / NRRL Y-8282 / UCD 70-5) TaxID=1071381 RepID=G8BWH5_TETPH|nr:hypothetical protein TPHA_0H02220 [Tetrapisispora phaffii CBS 4417]CCE64426.1 hypothetical protein TPHA_0H02220 [Tetrapisispora phaffii CBS 4417]